jgi:hypothetical protein
MNEINPGKALAAMRKIVIKPCGQCGKEFQGYAKGKWCSETCKQRAKRERKITAKKDQS